MGKQIEFEKGERVFVKDESHPLFGKVGTIIDKCLFPVVKLDNTILEEMDNIIYFGDNNDRVVISQKRLARVFETRTPNIKCGSFYQFKEGQTIITVKRPKGQDLSGSATVKIDYYHINPTLKQIFISFTKELSSWLQRKVK